MQVMVMETTGALQLVIPLMLTVFFAKVGCREFASAPPREARPLQPSSVAGARLHTCTAAVVAPDAALTA